MSKNIDDKTKETVEEATKARPEVLKSFVVPGLPHLLLCPEKKPEWQKLNAAFKKAAVEIEELSPDVILVYSSYWFSVLGHQFQTRENIKWTLVDEEWHELGSIPYEISVDADFAKENIEAAKARGLHARPVNYEGFPIDTGSVVALSLLNPKNKFKASIVSSNVYSDRAETVVLAKSSLDALKKQNKKAVVVLISSLSNRYLDEPLNYDQPERIHSKKDEEWNLKFLEFLSQGRLEDAAQLSRQFHSEARVTKKVVSFKPYWWLSAMMGETNELKGEVLEYQAVHGTGAALVSFTPNEGQGGGLEFDEDGTEIYRGDRNVL